MKKIQVIDQNILPNIYVAGGILFTNGHLFIMFMLYSMTGGPSGTRSLKMGK